jgi:hypothetical protein
LYLRFKEDIYADKAKSLAKHRAKTKDLLAFKPKPGLCYEDVAMLMDHEEKFSQQSTMAVMVGVFMSRVSFYWVTHVQRLLFQLEELIEEKKEVWPSSPGQVRVYVQVLFVFRPSSKINNYLYIFPFIVVLFIMHTEFQDWSRNMCALAVPSASQRTHPHGQQQASSGCGVVPGRLLRQPQLQPQHGLSLR